MRPEDILEEVEGEPKEVAACKRYAKGLLAYRDWYFEVHPDENPLIRKGLAFVRERELVPDRARIPPMVQDLLGAVLVARHNGKRAATQAEVDTIWRSGNTRGSGRQ